MPYVKETIIRITEANGTQNYTCLKCKRTIAKGEKSYRISSRGKRKGKLVHNFKARYCSNPGCKPKVQLGI